MVDLFHKTVEFFDLTEYRFTGLIERIQPRIGPTLPKFTVFILRLVFTLTSSSYKSSFSFGLSSLYFPVSSTFCLTGKILFSFAYVMSIL